MKYNSSPASFYRPHKAFGGAILALAALFPVSAVTAAMIELGTAESFGVLAGARVTDAGYSVVNADVGVSPDNAIIGLTSNSITGTFHAGDGVAAQAQADLTNAYNVAAGLAPTMDLTGTDLGGLTLVPGVYFFSSSAQLTGVLKLDLQGNSESQFVFQIGSTLTTGSDSSILLLNGSDACNIFFQITSSATLGSGTDFIGNIMALTSITMNTDATLEGRALARNGAVTLDRNVITPTFCEDDVPVSSVPEAGNTFALLGAAFTGLAGFTAVRSRRGNTLTAR